MAAQPKASGQERINTKYESKTIAVGAVEVNRSLKASDAMFLPDKVPFAYNIYLLSDQNLDMRLNDVGNDVIPLSENIPFQISTMQVSDIFLSGKGSGANVTVIFS